MAPPCSDATGTDATTSSLCADVGDPGDVLRALMAVRVESTRWCWGLGRMRACSGCQVDPTDDPTAQVALTTATAMVGILRKLAVVCARLRAHVVPFDRVLFGDTVDSMAELVVRGQMFLVRSSLRRVRRLLLTGTPAGQELARAVPADFCRHLDDMIVSLEWELQRITSLWVPLRNLPVITGQRAPLVGVGVRVAQREMLALPGKLRFGAFLQAASVDCRYPAVQTACSRAVIALELRFPDLDFPLGFLHAEGERSGARVATAQRTVGA